MCMYMLFFLGVSLQVHASDRVKLEDVIVETTQPYNPLIFKEINETFYVNKKPIHPMIVEQFVPSMMLRWQPKVISVDILNACDTNQYFDDFKFTKEGTTFTCYKKTGPIFVNPESFEYTWLGRLENGLHVVRTAECGGGTLTAHYLHFFKISRDDAYTPLGKKFKRVLLTVVRNYPLGDNEDCSGMTIELVKNTVTIKNNTVDSPIVLTCEDI